MDRLVPSSETMAAHYLWPRSGMVPPKCRYTLTVIMRPQRNPTFGNDGFFTLESTKARVVQGLRVANDPEEIFKRATERGFKVHEVKLAFVCARTEEVVQFHLAQKPQQVDWRFFTDGNISYDVDGLVLPGRPKFVSQKRWILVGLEDRHYFRQGAGYIYVYNYIAVQNFKGSKTYLVSKIKSIKAHDNGSVFLDVHPSRPYVLSLSVISDDDDPGKLKPVESIKLWDWENGWGCVKTFNMEEAVAGGAQFNPKDQDTFVTISKNGVVKVWNIDSPECTYTFTSTGGEARCFDFFSTQGGKQYLVIAEGEKCTIWDYHSGTLVETLKGNMGTVCSHPELPVLITTSDGTRGSSVVDGRVHLWSSSTFSLVGVLNSDLGRVLGVAGVKGSGRIVINHQHGIAVAEIGHMLESERPHESDGSEIE